MNAFVGLTTSSPLRQKQEYGLCFGTNQQGYPPIRLDLGPSSSVGHVVKGNFQRLDVRPINKLSYDIMLSVMKSLKNDGFVCHPCH